MSGHQYAVLFIILCLSMLSSGCILMLAEEKTTPYVDQKKAAANLTATVTASLTGMGDTLTTAASRIADDPTNSSLIAEEFTALYLKYQSVESLVVIDTENRVTSVWPKDNTFFKPYLTTILDDPDITCSKDSPAMNIVHFWYNNRSISAAVLPMISTAGTYEGGLIIILDPSLYYERTIHSFQRSTGYTAWVIDGDGYILYYPDTASTDTTIMQLKSPDQMQLDNLIENILQKTSGTGTYAVYNYGKCKITTHAAAWDTVTPYKGNGYSPKIVVTSELTSSQKIDYPAASTDLRLEEFVRSAYLFSRENGQEMALAEFNKPDGNFTTQEYYIAAFDRNNTLLANPYRQEWLGTDRTNYEDHNGVPAVLMCALRAKQGGGYVTHMWENPAADMHEELKISYVMPVNESWYILAGEFHPEIMAETTPDLRKEMIQYAREIKTFVQDTGKEAAAALLANGSRYRADMNLDIIDAEGHLLIHTAYPKTPENILEVTDWYGASIGRGVLALAKDGGGFRYINLPSQENAVTHLSLTYLEPVDDEWFILVSVPLYTLV